MKLSTKFIKLGKTFVVYIAVVVSVALAEVIGTELFGSQVRAAQLDDGVLNFYSQSSIYFYDPSCLTSGGFSSVCGDTPQEKYWSAFRQHFDEIHTAAIMGNVMRESGFSPTNWEIGSTKAVARSGGPFVRSWESLYNCQPCSVGVGAVGITYNLGNYLHYVNEQAPDLLKYFSDPSYSWEGEKALELIGEADFNRLVEIEVAFIYDSFKTDGIFSLETFESITDVNSAAQYFANKYERCAACGYNAGSSELGKRGAAAEVAYEEYKNFSCSGGGGGSSGSSGSVSGATSSDITLIGDSISVMAEAELSAKFPSSVLSKVGSRSAIGGAYCDDPGGLRVFNALVAGSGTAANQHATGACEAIAIDGSSLKDNVVWEIGTNNPATMSRTDVENMISSIGSNRKLFLVTPYNGYAPNKAATDNLAAMYREIAEEYNNVYIVDWNEAVRNDEGTYLITETGMTVHPTAEGRKLMADLIAEAVEGAQNCEPITYSDAEYQERLSNLHTFHQGSGTWAGRQEGCNSSGTYISNNGCGLMSIYAAYYMFSGQGLDDNATFVDLTDAAVKDGYYGCGGALFNKYGENLENFTGMKAELLWSGSYSDSKWDDYVDELKKGNKLLIGTTGASCSGSSLFAGCRHALLLDHYDAARDAVYLFDPNMSSSKVSTSGAQAFSGDVRDGAYISRAAMNGYLRPDSAVALTYKDNSCYNVCEPTGNTSTTPIYPLDEDSVDIACASGTSDYGTYDNPSWKGKSISIRLCKVDNLTSNGGDDPGFAIVNSRVSGAFQALAARAQSEGVNLIASSSFRTYERQYQFCYTYGWCSIGRAAAPGNSMHELGLAVDFNGTCGFGVSPSSCDATGNSISLWLRDNIEDFELYRPLSNEAWHVQPLLDGGS